MEDKIDYTKLADHKWQNIAGRCKKVHLKIAKNQKIARQNLIYGL